MNARIEALVKCCKNRGVNDLGLEWSEEHLQEPRSLLRKPLKTTGGILRGCSC